MSYIERAVYDYIIKVLSEGTRTLLSKRFILFTALLVASGSLSLLVTAGPVELDSDTVELVFLVQAATSIAFIVAGLVAKRLLSTWKRFLLLVVVVAVISAFGVAVSSQFQDIEVARQVLLEYYPFLCLFLWCLFMPIAGFGFARGMFYSRVTGSLLFLGKPEGDHRAIFYIFMALLALGGVGIGAGIVLTKEVVFIQSAGVLVAVASLLIFLVVFGVLAKNDTFNSTLAVFFLTAALPGMVMLFISNTGGAVSTFNYLLLGFSLIYTAQAQAKRASDYSGMSEEEIRVQMAKEKFEDKKRDPYGVGWLFYQLGAEGIVLIFLGTFLGYNLLHLEFFYGQEVAGTPYNPLLVVFDGMTVGQLYQVISLAIVTLIVVLLLLTYWLVPPVKDYFRSNLIRMSFLPTYDEAKAYITAVQSGEISKKEMTADAVKLVGGQLAKASMSGARGLLARFGIGSKDEDDR